jgi:hypothetical protein
MGRQSGLPFSHSSSLRACARSTCSRAMPSLRCISSTTCTRKPERYQTCPPSIAIACRMLYKKHRGLRQIASRSSAEATPPCGDRMWSAHCGSSCPGGPAAPVPRSGQTPPCLPSVPSRQWPAVPAAATAMFPDQHGPMVGAAKAHAQQHCCRTVLRMLVKCIQEAHDGAQAIQAMAAMSAAHTAFSSASLRAAVSASSPADASCASVSCFSTPMRLRCSAKLRCTSAASLSSWRSSLARAFASAACHHSHVSFVKQEAGWW